MYPSRQINLPIVLQDNKLHQLGKLIMQENGTFYVTGERQEPQVVICKGSVLLPEISVYCLKIPS